MHFKDIFLRNKIPNFNNYYDIKINLQSKKKIYLLDFYEDY